MPQHLLAEPAFDGSDIEEWMRPQMESISSLPLVVNEKYGLTELLYFLLFGFGSRTLRSQALKENTHNGGV